MVPRQTLTLLAFCALSPLVLAAPNNGRTNSGGEYSRAQTPASVQKTIMVEVMTPDGAWELRIEEIRQVSDELWVFAKLHRPDGAIAAMMVSAASDRVSGTFPDCPVKTFVVGKNWDWKNEEAVTWLSSSDASSRRRMGHRVWRR